MEMPIYECANGENASSRQKYPVFVRDVVWVPRVCEKAPNGTLQVYFQEAGKESFSMNYITPVLYRKERSSVHDLGKT